jgi:uncharacterized protein with FMN-binding domain
MSTKPPGLLRRAAPAAVIAAAAIAIVTRFDGGVSSLVLGSAAASSTSGATAATSSGTTDPGTGTTDSGSTTACGVESVGDTVDIYESGGHGRGSYGQVQVTAWISDGQVCDVQTAYQPYDGRSQRIDQQAIPMLDSLAVQSGSAQFDTISGATYTSIAYQQSLQAAIDAA